MNEFTKEGAAKEAGEDIAWTVAGAIADSAGGPFPVFVTVARLYRDLKGVAGESFDVAPNPRFLQNGHGGMSPKTIRYLKSRAKKSGASAIVGAASSLASSATQVDVFGTGQAGNAMFTTGAHMIQLRNIAKRYPRSETITGWIDVMQKAKDWKMGVRTADFAGAAIPVGAVGISTSIATAITRAGVRLTMGSIVARVAMEVHWRAKVEQSLMGVTGGGPGPNGPASAIMYEIFTKRGVTRLFGKYDTAKLIQEPGGFLALNDKMMLL